MATTTPDQAIGTSTIAESSDKKGTTLTMHSNPESKEDVSDDYRASFLATFTHEEEKRIMRKVDYRILVLFGLIYMVKQVRLIFI